MASALPATPDLPLNGADCFMLAMDFALRARNRRGNVCCLALTLVREVDEEAIRSQVQDSALFSALSSLRLVEGSLLRRHRWGRRRAARFDGDRAWRDLASESDLETAIWQWDILPFRDAPLQLALYRVDGKPVVVFAWHHALFDAHGAERLIAALGQGSDIPLEKALATRGGSGAPPLRAALDAKRHIFESARSPLARLPRGPARSARYCRIVFDEAETAVLDGTCKRLGAEIFRSQVYLAATARAVAAVLARRAEEPADMFVPLPHDIRSSRGDSAALRNRLAFLFFRIRAASLGSLKETTHDLLDQAYRMVERDLAAASSAMLNVFAPLPAPLYNRFVNSPTRGEFATFCFSDTGDSLSRLESFAGAGIADARHFPPHFAPPGLTAVFTRWRGRQTVTLVIGGDTLDTEEERIFLESLRADLLA